MVVIQFGARNRNRPSQKCSMIQKVQNTTVALMNTGAHLWRKSVQFSRPKIGKNNGSSTVWCIQAVRAVVSYCVMFFDSVPFLFNSTVQTT